jgi:hypothetical protein
VPYLPYHQDFRYTSRDSRYEPYEAQVAASDSVAYITTKHPELDVYLRRAFEDLNVQWSETTMGDYQIFYNLSASVAPTDIGLGTETP